ncbi:MAG: hypothetical protein GY854_17810 [Deltaproteobacteria bacterium]|nr:hypothetical protein [Deltaproteobacteria bacterium]
MNRARHRDWGQAWIRCLLFLPGPWLLVDRQKLVIVDASTQFDELLACSREYYMGRSIQTISAAVESSHWMMKEFSPAFIELPGRYEDVGLKRADGSQVVVDVHVSHPPRSERRPLAICLITDRTEQRRLQSELIGKHQELRRAFAELEKQSENLRQIKQTLEKSNRELGIASTKLNRATEMAAIGEITAELTHQLNNPLAAAIGAARQVEKYMRERDDPQAKTMTALLRNALERLRTTTADLRRVYITSRPVESPTEAFDLRPQIDSALAMLQQRIERMNVIVNIPKTLPRIAGRPSQIQHVIINLLDNAAGAAGSEGTLHVAAANNDTTIVLTVGDSGPGIPEHMRERVFEPFYTTREHGSGLGLAVVRRNLNHDGATISVGKSEYGGAEFEIGFPMATEQKEET